MNAVVTGLHQSRTEVIILIKQSDTHFHSVNDADKFSFVFTISLVSLHCVNVM